MHQVEREPLIIGQIVGDLQPLTDLGANPRGDRMGDSGMPFSGCPYQVAQVVAVDELSRYKELTVVFTDLVYLSDIGMVNPGDKTRFIEEHLDELALGGEMRMNDLQRHELLETGHPGQAADVDRGHPTTGQRIYNIILTNCFSIERRGWLGVRRVIHCPFPLTIVTTNIMLKKSASKYITSNIICAIH